MEEPSKIRRPSSSIRKVCRVWLLLEARDHAALVLIEAVGAEDEGVLEAVGDHEGRVR